MDRGAWRATVHGVAESDTTEWLTLSLSFPLEACLGGTGLEDSSPWNSSIEMNGNLSPSESGVTVGAGKLQVQTAALAKHFWNLKEGP